MTSLAKRVVRQHGFLVALVSAATVLAVRVLQGVLGSLLGQFSSLVLDGGSRRNIPWWTFYGGQLAVVSVPFSVGILLSLWFIAPIGPQLHVVHVVTRSLLAAATGAVLVFVTGVVTTVVSLVTTGLLGQIRFSVIAWESILQSWGMAFGSAGNEFLASMPLVILVGVLLRMWLERHPSEHDIAGIVDTA
jgi:hypothetical protein